MKQDPRDVLLEPAQPLRSCPATEAFPGLEIRLFAVVDEYNVANVLVLPCRLRIVLAL